MGRGSSEPTTSKLSTSSLVPVEVLVTLIAMKFATETNASVELSSTPIWS